MPLVGGGFDYFATMCYYCAILYSPIAGEGGAFMAWDVSIISTFKEVIAGINWLDAPAGILLFGADSDFKDQVHEKFLNNIIGIVEIDVSDLPQADSIGTASAPNGWNTLVVLTGDDSTDHAKRHHTVEALKRMGAKALIGVYVKQKPIYRESVIRPSGKCRKFNNQVVALLRTPPTLDGLNQLITISEN